jgi:hypothetical protein
MLFGGKWAYQYGSCRQIFKEEFELMVYALDRPFKKVWKIANFVGSFFIKGYHLLLFMMEFNSPFRGSIDGAIFPWGKRTFLTFGIIAYRKDIKKSRKLACQEFVCCIWHAIWFQGYGKLK